MLGPQPTGQRGRPGKAGTMRRPQAINRHAAPKRIMMLVHSGPLNPGRDDSQRMPNPAACCPCRTRGRRPSRVQVVFPRLNEVE